MLKIKNEIADALRNNAPIVALESTIISFGLPYPQNLETALECENIVRKKGAVPATIWIDNGSIMIGADEKDLHKLSDSKNVVKTNLSNLAMVLSEKNTGATTVSASLTASKLAGIKVFATGGIGGVHRNFSEILDISSDLKSISENDVITVSAGVKSILDIHATAEQLETLGIPVVGYKTNTFPGFYYRETDIALDVRADSPEKVVEIFNINKKIFGSRGILVVVPCPEEFALSRESVEEYISTIEKELKSPEMLKMYSGKKLTPYMLKRLSEITENKTLKANLALIKNNASVAADIALKLK